MNNLKVIKCHNLNSNVYTGVKRLFNNRDTAKSDKYFYWKIRELNIWNDFFMVGILNDVVVATCFVEHHRKINDQYLISDLIVDQDYQNNGYGTLLIETTIEILKEEGAVKICSFADPDSFSHNIFKKLGFVSNKDINSFSDTVPGFSDALYYELSINKEFVFEILNDRSIDIISMFMHKEAEKYKGKIPDLFMMEWYTWVQYFKTLNHHENEVGYSIAFGGKYIGYLYMFTVDYQDDDDGEHSIRMSFNIKKEYLCDKIFSQIVDQAKEFYKTKKSNFDIRIILVSIDDNVIEESKEDCKKYLLAQGFTSKDNIKYELVLEK